MFCTTLLNGCFDGKYIWSSNQDFNGICRLAADNGETVEFVGQFREEDLKTEFLYGNAIYYGGKIFFISMAKTSKYIIVSVDPESMKQTYYIRNDDKGKTDLRFSGICIWKNKLILIPQHITESIGVFDLDEYKMTWHKHWNNDLSYRYADGLLEEGVLYGKYYYSGIYHTNQIIKVDIDTLKTEIVELEKKDFAVQRVFEGDHCLWFMDLERAAIIKWDFNTWEYIFLPDDIGKPWRGIYFRDKVYIFPQMYPQISHKIGVYNCVKKEFCHMCISGGISYSETIDLSTPMYGNIKVVGNKIVALSIGLNKIIVIDTDMNEISYIEGELHDDILLKAMIGDKFSREIYLKERQGQTLENYLEYFRLSNSYDTKKNRYIRGENCLWDI